MHNKIILFVCSLFFTAITTAQSEFLNSAFGNNGSVCITTPEEFSPVVMGDLVKVGQNYYGITGFGAYYLIKLSSTGVVDSSFGTNGYIQLNLGNPGGGLYDFSSTFIKHTADNNLVIVNNSRGLAGHSFMVKTDLDGNVVTGFGTNGYIDLVWPERLNFITVDISGNEIILTGTNDSTTGDEPYRYVIALKYDLNGNPVTAFGNSGSMVFYLNDVYSFPKAGYYDTATGMLTVNVDGYADTDLQFGYSGLMQYDIANGTQNTSFGINGIVYVQDPYETATYSVITNLTVDSDGNVYAGGHITDELSESHVFLKKYNPSGIADASFGDAGTALFDIEGANYEAVSTINKTANHVTITGMFSPENAAYEKLFLLRTQNNGALATDFGNNGIVIDETPSGVVYTASYKTLEENQNLITVATLSNACTNSQPKPSVVQFITGTLAAATASTNKTVLYPNPVKANLYINSTTPIKNVEVYDISAKLLSVPVDINAQKVDFSTLKPGVYILKLHTVDGITTSKIIKD